MSSSAAAAVLSLALLAVPAPGAAQEAVDVSARAEALVRAGEAEKARTLVARTLARCAEGQAGSACRQRLRFTLAWIAERRSASAPAAAARALLDEAADSYSSILAEAPAHAPTLANLAGVEARLGRTERAIELLRRAADADPSHAAAYAVAEGDLDRQARRLDAARRAYGKAVAADPTDETARLRIVALYEHEELEPARDLLDACADWELASLAAADAGYLAVIRRTHASSPLEAEDALARWVSAEARLDRLSEASLAALPQAWKGAAVEDLRRYLREPRREGAAAGWWTSGSGAGSVPLLTRRHVLAQAALALGRAARTRGEEKRADAIWTGALRFAPEIYEYHGSIDGLPIVRLDLVSELMLLLSDDPELDARAERFRVQETQLFEEKAGAYQAGDLASIQRFHTVLGLVYARRQAWRSGDRYHNAVFQLEHAISTSEERARREGRAQALPALRRLLAQGYLETARTGDARTQLLLAARDELDVDDVGRAERLLGDASAQGGSAAEAGLREQLLQIVKTRREAQSGDPARAVAAIDPAQTPALFQPRSPRLDRQFLARQRFKVLAHVAEAQRGKASPVALDAAAKALQTAAEGSVALQGVGDLRRLEVTRAILSTEGRMALPKVRTSPQRAPPVPLEGKALPLVYPGSTAAAVVHLDADVLVAARVVSAMGARTVRSPDVRLRVRAGEVEVKAPPAALPDPGVIAKVKDVEGVRSVVQRP